MKFQVHAPQKGVRLIPAILNGSTGTPVFTEGQYQMTVADGGVGIYDVTLREPCARAPVVMATPKQTDLIVEVVSPTVTGFQVRCFDASDGTTAKDGNLQLLVCAFDAPDEV